MFFVLTFVVWNIVCACDAYGYNIDNGLYKNPHVMIVTKAL